MGKTVEKVSKSGATVKSGAKAVKGLDLDMVKSAMTPDKVKVSTPVLKGKKDPLTSSTYKSKFTKELEKAKFAKKKQKLANKAKKNMDEKSEKTDDKENVDEKSEEDENATKKERKKEKKAPIDVKHLEFSTIDSGVEAFLKLLAAKTKDKEEEKKEDDSKEDKKMEESSKSDLFDGMDDILSEESSKIFLQVSGIKIPSSRDQHTLKQPLPHGFLEPDANILLIVKDLKKGNKHDHEDTLLKYQDLIRNAKINANIEVMPFRQLRVEYHVFELKRHLASRIDRVLVDKNIMSEIPKYLGKPFYKKRKLPVAVDLAKQDLNMEFTKAIRTTLLPLNNQGVSNSVPVGRTNQTHEQLTENIKHFVKRLRSSYPGGWKNVRSVALLSNNKSIFLYMTERNNDELGEVKTLNYGRNKREPVEGELSTIPGVTVTVSQDGNVSFKRVPDPEWDEKVEGGDPTADDEPDEKAHKRAKMDNETDIKKKGAENKAESESEDDVEGMEMEYMKKVAEEEEEIEKKEKENLEKLNEADQKKSAASDAKEDSDEDDASSDADDASDAADDDIEAENLVSDEDDVDDDDDEQLIKRKQVEEETEEPPAKKEKKIKKTQKRRERKEAAKSAKIEKSPKLKKGQKPPAKKHQEPPKKHLSKKNNLNGVKAGKISKK